MKVVMTLLVRDEVDVVDAQLAYHLHAGIDEVVAMESYPAGSGEAGGEDNRRWCALFHRQARPVTKRRLEPTLRVPRARTASA